MCSAVVNTACINAALSFATIDAMPNAPHPSAARLFDVARAHGDRNASAIAKRMNVSAQMVTNWGKRGVSQGGALQAQSVYGCDANWLLGTVNANTPPAESVDREMFRAAVACLERVFQSRRITMDPDKRAHATMMMYDVLREQRDEKTAERMVAHMLQLIGGGSTTS